MKKQDKTNVKLWNKNFILLWQGQFVSAFGDALYAIALNFFVLQETGSTAIMGTLPLSPFCRIWYIRKNWLRQIRFISQLQWEQTFWDNP